MHDCIFLDFGNQDSHRNYESVKNKLPYVNRQRFFGNFKGTLDRVISKSKTEWCWITSSISNYDSFDFDFEINYHQRNHLHVFPANQNKMKHEIPTRFLLSPKLQSIARCWLDSLFYLLSKASIPNKCQKEN